MEQILKDYGRYLLLEGQLPGLAQKAETSRREALALERERSQKKWDWESWEQPGFFQRLLGNREEKREKAHMAFLEADSAWKQAVLDADQAAQALQLVKGELESLASAPEIYAQLEKTQEVKLLAQDAFRPAALQALEACLNALEQALQWENQERNLGGRMPNQDDGMWERLSAAREPANRLKQILMAFPEPDSWTGGYLENPDGFIYDGVIMKASPRNKIRVAIGQLEKLKERLQ